MPLADFKLSDIVERPAFKALPKEEQRTRKIEWIKQKTVQLRENFGDQFEPQSLITPLKEQGLIDDLIPDPVDTPQERLKFATDETIGLVQRVFGRAGTNLAAQAVAQTGAALGTVVQNAERALIETILERQPEERLKRGIERGVFNSRLLSTDPKIKRQAFEAEVDKRLSKTFGTFLKNKSRAVVQGVDQELEESGIRARLDADAARGTITPETVATMIGQSLPIMVTAVASTIAAGPAVGVLVNTPILGGFSAEELNSKDISDQEKLGRMLVSGFTQSVVEQIVPARLVRTKNFKNIGEVLQNTFAEGLAEVTQRVFEMVAVNANTAKDIADILKDPKNHEALLQEFLAGAALGGLFSGVQQTSLFVAEKLKNDTGAQLLPVNELAQLTPGQDPPELIASLQSAQVPPEQVFEETLIPQLTEGERIDADNRQETQETDPRLDPGTRQEIVEGRGGEDQALAPGQTGQRALQGDRADQERLTDVPGEVIEAAGGDPEVAKDIVVHSGPGTFVENTQTPVAKVKQDAINARSFKRIFGESGKTGGQGGGLLGEFPNTLNKLPIKRGPLLPKETVVQAARRKILDSLERLRVAQAEIEKQDGIVREESDVFQAKRLEGKRISARVDLVVEELLNPLAKKIAESPYTQEEIDLHAHALHAIERNEKMGQEQGINGDGLSGLTRVEAIEILTKFRDQGKLEGLEEYRKGLAELIERGYLDYLVEGGVISVSDKAAIQGTYKFYVPLGREMQEFATSGTGGSKGSSVTGTGIFKAVGSTKTVLPITSQVFNKIHKGIELVQQNLVAQKLATLVRENPSPALWTIETPRAIGKKFGPDGELIFQDPKENQIGFRENGVQKYITIHDALVLRALKNEGLTKSIPLFSNFIRLQSSLITAYDLTFGFRNFQRDFGEAIINIQEIKELELTEEQRKGMTRSIIKTTPSILKDMFKHLRGNKTTKWSGVINRFVLAGGQSGAFWMRDVAKLDKEFKKAQVRYARQGFKRLANAPKHALDFIQNVNEAAENAVRVSVFNALIQRGVTDSKAAFIAGEITIDFNRQGEWGPFLKSLWVFANPRIQGPARALRALTSSRRVQLAAAGLFMIGAVRTYISMFLDEDADEAIFDYTKNTSITLPIPGFDTSVTILSLPYGFNSFFATGSNFAYWTSGKKTKTEALRDTLIAAMDSFNPLGGSHMAYTEALPTIIKPLAEIERNEGWHGSPIYPTRNKFEAKVPDSELYWKSTGDTAKTVSQWLANISKTERSPNGSIQISPSSIEYAVTQYGGGFVRGIENTFDTTVSLTYDGKLPKSSHIPFIREIFKDFDIERYNRNLAYEMLDNSKLVKYAPFEVERFEKAAEFLEGKQKSRVTRQFKRNQREINR